MKAATPQKARSRLKKKYSFLFLFLGLFLAADGLFMAGFNIGTGDGVKSLGNFVVAAVGLILALMIVADWLHSIHNHNTVIADMARELTEKFEREADPKTKKNTDELLDAMMEVCPDGPPETDDELRAIEVKFKETTGRFAALSFRRDDAGDILGMDSEFSQAAPEATEAVPGHKVPVIRDSVLKPLTKSQQRRINDKKGLGPITDDEVKEARNEKRRAARAAKKAESVQITHNPETANEVEPTLKEKIAQQS